VPLRILLADDQQMIREAIAMILVAVLIAGTILRLIGPSRVMSWIVRRLYGR